MSLKDKDVKNQVCSISQVSNRAMKVISSENQHSLVFQIPTASKNAYKKSFFPQTIRDWNVLPDSLISSAELSDDCVSKFTSLVRARG